MLWKKQLKAIVLFIIDMVAAGSLSLFIFPAMLTHIFFGYRGKESLANLSDTFSGYIDRIKQFNNYMNNSLWGGGICYIIVILLFMGVIYFNNTEVRTALFQIKSLNIQLIFKWAILVIPCTFYFLLIAKIAVYIDERYIFPLYAITFAWAIAGIVKGIFKFFSKPNLVLAILLSIFIINGWNEYDGKFLYSDSKQLLNDASEYSNLDCIVIYDGNKWKLGMSFYELSQYNSVTFIRENQIDFLTNLDLDITSEIIVTTIGNNEDILEKMIENSPLLNQYEKLGGYGYTTTWRIYSDMNISVCKIWDYEKTSQISYVQSNDSNFNINLTEKGNDLAIVPSSNDYSYIFIKDRVFDVQKGIFSAGTDVQPYVLNGTDAQKWRIQNNIDDSVTIFSFDDKFVLAHDEDGNIHLSEYDINDNTQKWWLELTQGEE